MTKRPRNRRWLRLVVPPVSVLVVVLLGTWVYQLEQPDLTDNAYLSPVSDADTGAATLAGRVRAAGVSIERATTSSDALVSAYEGGATLLVTTPQLVNPLYLRMIKLLPATTTVVLVEPDRDTIVKGLLPFWGTYRALVSEPTGPGCTFAPAAQAGRAGVRRTRYSPVDTDAGREVARCYDDSLVVYERGARVVVVGSADPFRNDRIGEHHNAQLATGLLTGARKLIWLDLHRREPPPLVNNDPGLAGGPAAPPSLRPYASGEPVDPDFPVQGRGGDAGGGAAGGNGDGGSSGEQDDGSNPLWHIFPGWIYVTAALIVLAVVLLALAVARRLGAPVVEPLLVVVRASETVTGRGRLYQRARARGESLRTLRDSALVRLVRLLRLEPDVQREVLVEAVVAQSGWPLPVVMEVLFGAEPQDDLELVQAATQLERLVNAVAATDVSTPVSAAAAAPEGEPR